MRVLHNQYGEGTIIEKKSNTSIVDFDNHGKIEVSNASLSQLIFG